jgi:GNAT superfamily N-acetyltransferase
VTGASPLSLAREAEPAAAAIRAISDGLGDYNAAFYNAGGDWTPQYWVGRDAAGAVRSGAKYVLEYDWLFVNWLWVAEPYRRRGEGRRLLSELEAEALRRGCKGVYLDTFSFQAPEFYAKLGYREFGRIAGFPGGFDRIWLAKRF